ncbi:potassium channel, sub T, member 2 [Haplosporangium sp. Z 11]|nr:potassium channel, sub T, member 2 [Haplosporangium sp. Z 11]
MDDRSMEEVQEARQTRRNGPLRLLTNRMDTSYNNVRRMFRLQYAEKRKSDIRNIVSSIRLGLDYDVYKAKVMALLKSKARTIFFIMMDLMVDALFCILYIVEAHYQTNNDPTGYPTPSWLFVPRPKAIWIVAVAMSSWNLMSAFIRFIFADNKWTFIFSIQTLLDAITAIPFLLSGAFLPNGQWLYVPYFLRSWSVISRLQRALSIGVDIGISDQPFDPVKAKLIALVAYFVAILYNGMAAFLYCETTFAPKTEAPHTVWDAFYFILITASTVGYGDITPKSFEGKLVVMVFIIVALSIVPGLIAGTIETLKSSRSGGGSYIQSRGANGLVKEYLIMIGDFQSAKYVADMLDGFFSKDSSDNDMRVVFLSRNKPSEDVKTLLSMPMHKNRTTMLVGNGLDEVDLKRCQARDAAGVFIIPDRTTTGLESQDTMTTLLAWSLHIYAPETRVFTFNLLPETESFQWGIVEQSMCISDVKQLLLAYNCRHRGTSTLILNLLHPSEPANNYDDGWKAQYGDGTGNELYVDSVPDIFIGWTFSQVAWFVFQEFQSILIGVDIFLKPETAFTGAGPDGPHYHDYRNQHKPKSMPRGLKEYGTTKMGFSREYHLTLNPGNSYRLGKYDQLVYIAQSPQDVEAIGKFDMEQYERLLNDEKGHLDSSRADFAKAMNIYHALREARAEARLAAKDRAERRKGKRARKLGDYPATSPSDNGHDVQLSEKWVSDFSKDRSTSVRLPGSQSVSDRSWKLRRQRPAWNVALYDDDDDDDDDDDNGSLRDDHSMDQTGSRLSRQSFQTHQSRQSNQSWRNSIVRGKSRQRKSGDHEQNRDLLMGALEREEVSQSNEEFTPPSKSQNKTRPVSQNQRTVSELLAAPGALDGCELYPSNFDKNAVVAAAEESADVNEDADYPNRPMSLGKSTEQAEEASAPFREYLAPPNAMPGTTGGRKLSLTRPPLIIPTASRPQQIAHTSIQGSFQTLDETTYIGQTSVTRSETKDLPLCHLLFMPPDSIKPLIKDDLSSLKNHIVVCANPGENLYRFLATLRLAQISRDDLKTIVVLTKNPLGAFTSESSIHGKAADQKEFEGDKGEGEQYSEGNWDAILSFPRVFWVAGNCRNQRDLVRAGILGASSIVIMAHSAEGLDRDEFADSTAIMAHHMVHQTLQHCGLLGRQHIIVDIAEKSNIRFLSMRDRTRTTMTGHEAFSNSSLISGRNGGFWMTPLFASGQVLVSSLLDDVLFQAYSKTHIQDLVKLCCGVRLKQAMELDQMLGIDSSMICLMDTPAQFVGKSFLGLFQTLSLLYGIVPLGLYRAPDRELNNALPFVFCNPLPGILLKQTDMIYVLKP